MTVNVHAEPSSKIPARFRLSVPRIVRFVLRAEKTRSRADVSVVFVDKKKIRRLNRQFLNEKGDTDVIAFPYDGDGGDIFICAAVGAENARRFKEPYERELTRLVVHGTLHLLGYADEPKKERDKMWARQEPIVDALWKKRK